MSTKTTVVTERGQVSIPASIRKEMGLKPGQLLVWEKLSDRECLIRLPPKKKPLGAKAMLGFAARFRGEKGMSTDKWMAILREGEK